MARSHSIVPGSARAEVLLCQEGISFWGGVDPETGRIIDIHHPNHGENVAGKILMMPTSRGSCSGSGVLLELALNDRAPAAIVFSEREEILTLGALVAGRIFQKPLPVISLIGNDYNALANAKTAQLLPDAIIFDDQRIGLEQAKPAELDLSDNDLAMLEGKYGPAMKEAMHIICLMAAADGANSLLSVSRGHIDGCILAHSANLIFAEKMADMGAKVSIPTTINAISVDRENWQHQNVPSDFGARASRLADAYVRMGAAPTFTCAPYLLAERPKQGEIIGWSESNAVIFANSILGARSPKHPDYLDLFIAMTGRAPASGVYVEEGRRASVIIHVKPPKKSPDDLFWPMLGWLAGKASPDQIPLILGLENLAARRDDLKAMCAAFGTTSGAPMLHVAGHTPEAHLAPKKDARQAHIAQEDFKRAWHELNQGNIDIDVVAIGSPHASVEELEQLVQLFANRSCAENTKMIVTLGRNAIGEAKTRGITQALEKSGVKLLPDLCWCSIIEPIFPTHAQGLMTNSGKYAHYAHGIIGRHARLGSLKDCVEAAISGKAKTQMPDWLA